MGFVSDVVDAVSTGLSVVGSIAAPVTNAISSLSDSSILGLANSVSNIANSINTTLSDGLFSLASNVGGVVQSVDNVVNGTRDILSGILSPIEGVLNGVTGLARDINDGLIRPIVDPIRQTISLVDTLSNTINNAVSKGVDGLLQIPQDIADALTSVDATFQRAIGELGLNNQTIASQVLGPAIREGVGNPLGNLGTGLDAFHETSKAQFERGLLQAGILAKVNLDDPPALGDIDVWLDEKIKWLSGKQGWIGELLSGFMDVATIIEFLIARLEPRNEVYKELAFRNQPVTRLDPATVTEALSRQIISEENARDELLTRGYDKTRQDVLIDLADFFPDANLGLEWWWRGLITDHDLNVVLAELSYDADQIVLARAGSSRIPGPAELREWFLRGAIDEVALTAGLTANRYTTEQIAVFKALINTAISSQGLISTAARRDAISKGLFPSSLGSLPPPNILEAGQLEGRPPQDVESDWIAHWALPGSSFWTTALFRDLITRSTFDAALNALAVPPELHDTLIEGSRELIEFRTISTLLKKKALTEQQAREQYKKRGFSPDDIEILIAEGIAGQKVPKAPVAAKQKDVSLATAAQLFTDGTITVDQYKAILKEHDFSEEAATLEIRALQIKTQQQERKDELQFLEDLVGLGQITTDQALSQLFADGFSQSEVAKFERAITRQRAKKSKLPSLGDLEKMLKKGLIDQQTFLDTLIQEGYSDVWAGRILELFTAPGA